MQGSRGRTRVRRGRLGVGDEVVKDGRGGGKESRLITGGIALQALGEGKYGLAGGEYMWSFSTMVETRQYLYPPAISPFPLRHCPITLDSPILPFPTIPVLPMPLSTLAPILIPMNRSLPIPE